MAKTVCIIDDDDLVRAHMGHTLRAEGFLVMEAETAREGLKMVAEQLPDVVLIDLIMPDRDGIETIAELRRRWPQMPIVAISGGGRVGPSLYLELAASLGASACLSKPLRVDLFKQAIGEIDQPPGSDIPPE
jgi:CheY-like chemotaxis protein